jgi:hypothetical protein
MVNTKLTARITIDVIRNTCLVIANTTNKAKNTGATAFITASIAGFDGSFAWYSFR